MATEQQVKVGMGSLLVDFRRVREENRELVCRYSSSCLFELSARLKVRIIDTRQVEALTPRSMCSDSLTSIRIPMASNPGSMRTVS